MFSMTPTFALDAETIAPISLGVRVATLVAILGPVVGLVVAVALCWGWGFTWVDLGLLAVMYLLTGFGITVGYHRLFVHRSFETSTVVKFALAILGSMAVEGPLLKWVAQHRRHHQHSDKIDDPHTPHHHGRGVVGWIRGYWRAHIGWFFEPTPVDMSRYVPDLERSRALLTADVLCPLWITLGLLIPAVLGGLLTRSWTGVWSGFIWGGLVRVFLVHHMTWSVNSACHLWGFRPYRSGDQSRNNIVFGILALGEGWHNTHHAFPTSARHGLRWWQLDLSYWLIWAMELVGLAWNVKLPSKQAQADRETQAVVVR
jgi:stearoyl-CoA desaturase (Delta-9 desaturase)